MSDLGFWLIPAKAAPLLGRTTREVQQLCQDRLIEHQRIESPGGRVRYLISEQAVRGYLNRTVIPARRPMRSVA